MQPLADLPLIVMDQQGDLRLRVGVKEETSGDEKEEARSSPPDAGGDARRFLVCSNTLCRTSPVFERMLRGSFIESKGRHQASNSDSSNPSWTVDLPEDDPSAFEKFALIAHGYLNRIPRSLPTDELYELSRLTHYYDATHLLVPWVPAWLGGLRDRMHRAPRSSAELPKMLWIGWELGQRQMFEEIAYRMTMECSESCFHDDGPLRGLQMPPKILETIVAIRRQTKQAVVDLLREFIELLVVVDEKPRWCQHATWMGPHRCESMILGSMTFCLTRAGLWPLPDAEGIDMSVVRLHETLTNLVIHDIGNVVGGDHADCNPKAYLAGQVKKILVDMPEPMTEELRRQLERQAERLYG